MTAVTAAMAAATGGAELANCRGLTNLNDINRLLHEVVARERAIDSELEQQLGRRGEIERSLQLTSSSTAEVLEVMQVDAEQLQGSVASTADLADRVSRKVRELDVAGSAVEGALSRIRLVMDRSNCIDGVKAAMESEDFEAAARYVSTYLQLDGQAAPLEEGQGEDQAAVLQAARKQLGQVVRERFRTAVDSRDHAGVIRFTKLYVPLSLHTEGLNAFTGYLVHLIAGRATEDYSTLADAVGSNAQAADFVGVLTNLFKDIAIAVDENEALVQECFGAEGVLHVMQELQAECDTAGSRVLRRYLEHRRLQRLVKEIGGAKHRAPPVGSPERSALVDPLQVESFLDEIVMISQRSEEYNGFMLGKLRAVGGELPGHATRENVFRGGQFNCTVREVIGYYITMEEFYVEEMVNKAIALDETSPDQLVSSMVDDTFFIMQKCARRALATSSLQCSCALLTELNNILSSGFRAAVAGKLSNCAQRLMAAMPSDAQLAESLGGGPPHEAAVVINGAETSGMYMQKLRQEIEYLAMELFAGAQERERVKSCLADLSKTSSDFHTMTAKSLDTLASAMFPRLCTPLDEIAQLNYQPSEAEYSAMEVEEQWTQRLLVAMEARLSWLRPMLVPDNYDGLVAHLVDKVAARLEAIVAKKRFNQLGGLQIDKDIRTLVSYMSELTQRTVRDKFARLTQMATVLSLEAPSEILDYWGENSGPITWRFGGAEVKDILAQRVDFTRSDLEALVLE